MPESRTTAWLLSPEQLVAACAAVGILGLPHSRWVDEEISHEAYVASVGGRSLQASRLAAVQEGVLCIEPSLAEALLSLTGDGHDAVASFTGPEQALHVCAFAVRCATTMIESSDGIEVIAEPTVDALARLESVTTAVHAEMAGLCTSVTPRASADAVIHASRWDALLDGRPARRADNPLAVEAAVAAREHGIWEGACLRMTKGGGYVGQSAAWVFDECGLMTVDLGDPDDLGELPLEVSAVADPAREIAALWEPLRAFVAALPVASSEGPGPELLETRRPVSHA